MDLRRGGRAGARTPTVATVEQARDRRPTATSPRDVHAQRRLADRADSLDAELAARQAAVVDGDEERVRHDLRVAAGRERKREERRDTCRIGLEAGEMRRTAD